MRVLSRFVTSAVDAAHFPPAGLPEVAFLGRSNVGKSSLINALVGTKIAKTSSTPGRTQMINFFELQWPGKSAPEMQLADLPGYGYALPTSAAMLWQSLRELTPMPASSPAPQERETASTNYGVKCARRLRTLERAPRRPLRVRARNLQQ